MEKQELIKLIRNDPKRAEIELKEFKGVSTDIIREVLRSENLDLIDVLIEENFKLSLIHICIEEDLVQILVYLLETFSERCLMTEWIDLLEESFLHAYNRPECLETIFMFEPNDLDINIKPCVTLIVQESQLESLKVVTDYTHNLDLIVGTILELNPETKIQQIETVLQFFSLRGCASKFLEYRDLECLDFVFNSLSEILIVELAILCCRMDNVICLNYFLNKTKEVLPAEKLLDSCVNSSSPNCLTIILETFYDDEKTRKRLMKDLIARKEWNLVEAMIDMGIKHYLDEIPASVLFRCLDDPEVLKPNIIDLLVEKSSKKSKLRDL